MVIIRFISQNDSPYSFELFRFLIESLLPIFISTLLGLYFGRVFYRKDKKEERVIKSLDQLSVLNSDFDRHVKKIVKKINKILIDDKSKSRLNIMSEDHLNDLRDNTNEIALIIRRSKHIASLSEKDWYNFENYISMQKIFEYMNLTVLSIESFIEESFNKSGVVTSKEIEHLINKIESIDEKCQPHNLLDDLIRNANQINKSCILKLKRYFYDLKVSKHIDKQSKPNK